MIEQRLIPKGKSNRPANPMKAKGLLYHATSNWNPNADAEMHAKYLFNTNEEKSWHVTVDAIKAIQHLPFNENGWHGGDGQGEYNLNWIGVEICCNRVKRGEPLDKATYDNAVKTIAEIMISEGLTELRPHKVVYGKNCPHDTLFNHTQFEKDVKSYMEQEQKKDEIPAWAIAGREWAVREGISDGTRPNDTMTRAELWTMLYRYDKHDK